MKQQLGLSRKPFSERCKRVLLMSRSIVRNRKIRTFRLGIGRRYSRRWMRGIR